MSGKCLMKNLYLVFNLKQLGTSFRPVPPEPMQSWFLLPSCKALRVRTVIFGNYFAIFSR